MNGSASATPRQPLCIRGDISVADACRLHSHLVSDHQATETSVSLLLLHGSWNNLLCRPVSTSSVVESVSRSPCQAISSVLYAACGSSPHPEVQTCPVSVASVTVDRDEISQDAAVDTLRAPPNLPALAVVAGGDVGSGGVMAYADIDHTVLLSLLRSSYSGDSTNQQTTERHREYERVSVAVAHTLTEVTSKLQKAGRLGSTFQPMDVVDEMKSNNIGNGDSNDPALRIFIAGDRSQVGKSSVCLGLLGALLKMGYPPSSLAYIKPATQCEATQLVAQWCDKHNIANRPIGPVVYYKGFTRAFLAGETTEGTEELLAEAGRAVDDIAEGKRVVIVDGVGYPAVGSICGTDNASVAAACGISRRRPEYKIGGCRIPVPVLLVGKSGVGDAIDSFNLNATYFESKGVPVLGSVFNRLSIDGFYSLENCKKAVTSYFEQYRQGKAAFGFIPEVEGISKSRQESQESDAMDSDERSNLDIAMGHADQFIEAFSRHVDVAAIVSSAVRATEESNTRNEDEFIRAAKRPKVNNPQKLANEISQVKLTRAQIEQAAKISGAAGG